MIEEKNGVFHLQNDSASYLFRVTQEGFLQQLHFGVPVQIEDAGALAVQPGLGWGDSVQYDEVSNASLRRTPSRGTWSGAGRGDYRESPLNLSEGERALSTDFRFEGFALHDEAPMHSGLPQSRGGQALEICLYDEAQKLRLRLGYPCRLRRTEA